MIGRGRSRVGAAVVGLQAAFLLAGGSLAAQVVPDTVRAGRFDFGKMWTFEHAPAEYFSREYGFTADSAWFATARMAALRIPGCSASFVSPNGLLATNHHCVRGRVAGLSGPGENLLDNGFLATSLERERPIPGYYADQLIAALDVSDEVFAAVDAAPVEQRESARRSVLQAVEARLRTEYADLGSQLHVQVIPLYQGGRYSAYVFRRFTDIRLVAAAELQLGFFGGDPDNFTYPRHALDFAFLRVYGEDGQPFATEHYFRWGSAGVAEGDPVFLIGNPGPTNRLNTMAQLEYQRDVLVPAVVGYLDRRLRAMRAFYAANRAAGDAIDIRNRMFSLSNSLKAQSGRLAGLRNPDIMARKRDAERQLIGAIRADSALAAESGDLIGLIAGLQQSKRETGPMMAAIYGMSERFAPTGFERRMRAVGAHLVDGTPAAGVPVASGLPPALEEALLAIRLEEFQRHLGPDHPLTRAALNGGTPQAAAAALLATSVLGDSARLATALARGPLPAADAGVALARLVEMASREVARDTRPVLEQEEELEAELGRARYAVYGTTVAPDASSSPRITDGRVLPYEYNGTLAPVYTTFYGMYELNTAHGQDSEWALPTRWAHPPAGLDLATPLNFISTADSYGGNSGSPAFTRDLALVGLNFDRNIEGLPRAFIYLPEQGRNVMVDVRAIEAALDQVYDLDRIAQEVRTGRLFATEQEADAAARR
jgi:Peptidase S46